MMSGGPRPANRFGHHAIDVPGDPPALRHPPVRQAHHASIQDRRPAVTLLMIIERSDPESASDSTCCLLRLKPDLKIGILESLQDRRTVLPDGFLRDIDPCFVADLHRLARLIVPDYP